MRFFVVRLKSLIFAVVAVVLIAVICMTSGRAVMTFLSGNREIPIYSVAREDNKIALTFDCAWNDDDIDEIVDTLNKYNVKATFFVTGKWAEDYSAALNKLYRNGFEIGIHSYNHDDYTKMSASDIAADIQKCDDIIAKITGTGSGIVRAPSGAYNDTAVRTIENGGRFCIQWSVDGIDYTETTADEIYTRVVPETEAGDIILLHNGTELTAGVLPSILEALKKNYELVNVSDLIYKDNFTVDYAGKQTKSNLI